MPYVLSQGLATAFQVILPPSHAMTAARVLELALASGVIGGLVRRYRLPLTAVPVLVVLLALDSGFWNGYAGHPLGLVIIGGWLLLPRHRQLTWWAVLLVSTGSDSLSWPHHDGLGWLHLVGVSGGVTV